MKRSLDSAYVIDFVKSEKDSMSADFKDDHKSECIVIDSDSDDPTVVYHELIKNPKLEGGDVLESCMVSASKVPNSNNDSISADFNDDQKSECIVIDSDSDDPTVVYHKLIKNPKLEGGDVSERCMVSASKVPNSNGLSQMDCVNGVSETKEYIIGVNANHDLALDCTENFESSLFMNCSKSTKISSSEMRWAAVVSKIDCSNGISETSSTNNDFDLNCTTNFFESSLFSDSLKSTNISCFGTACATNVLKTDCVDGVPGLKDCVTEVESTNISDALELNCTKNFFETSLFLNCSEHSNLSSSGIDCAAVVSKTDCDNGTLESGVNFPNDDIELDCTKNFFESSLFMDRSKSEIITSSKMLCAAVDGSNNANEINDSLLDSDSDDSNFDYVNDGFKIAISSKFLNSLKSSAETCNVPQTDCARVLPFLNSTDIDDSQKKYLNNCKYFGGSNPANPTNDPTKVYTELLFETKDTYKKSMNMKLGSVKRDSRSIKFINNGNELDCIDGQNAGDTHGSEVDLAYSEFVDDSKPIDTNVSSGSAKSIKDVANDKMDCVEDVSEFSKFINNSKSVCTNDWKISCSNGSFESLITTSNYADNDDDSILDFETDATISSNDVFKIPYILRTKNGFKRLFSVSNSSDTKDFSTKYFGSSNSANPTNDPTKVYLDFFDADDISESIDGPNFTNTIDHLKIDCAVESSKFVNSSNSADIKVVYKTECVDDDSKVSYGKLATPPAKYFEDSNSANGIEGSETSGIAIRSKYDNNNVKNFDVILGDSTKCNEESNFVNSKCDPKETRADVVSRSLNFINGSKSDASYYVAKKSDADVNSDTLESSDRLNSTDTNFNATVDPNSPKYLNGSNFAKSDSSTLMNGSKSARTKHVHEKNLADISHITKCFGNMNLVDNTYNTKAKDVTANSVFERDFNGLNHTMANYIPNIDCSETVSVSTKSIDDFKSAATNVVPKTVCANILSNLGKCSHGSKIVSESLKFVDETKSASNNSDIQPDCDIVSADSTKCVNHTNFLDTLISFDLDEGSVLEYSKMDHTEAVSDFARCPVVSNSTNINIHRKKYCNIGSDSIKNLCDSNSANINNDPLLVYPDLIDVSEDSDDSSVFEFSRHAEKDVASTSTNDPKIAYSDVVPESAESNSNAIDYEMQCPSFTILKNQRHCPKVPHLNYEYCIPLLVQDIVKIKIGENLNNVKSIYGINFHGIMIYGQAIPLKLKFDTNERIYSVDDGTGSVTVRYRHTPKQLQTIRTLDTLTSELTAIKRERYTKRKQSQDKSQHDSFVKSMDILLRKCKKQSSLPMEFFTRGAKVSVIGLPYSHHGVMYLWATEMTEDSEPSRSKEIFFKQNLIRYYKEIYSEHRTD